ncbi:MAG: hypothetical protein JSV24_01210 [Bacteroidales bacterium]|nr:MAG: hypothetical protein JSV24_01210 [Bacteroidales bacterium]
MKKICFALGIILLAGTALSAQKIVLKSGDLDFLKGEKFIDIEYDYSNMAVGKFDKEEDYVNKKVDEYDKKYPGTGRGEQWKEAWIGDRKARFQPSFEELLNKYLEKPGVYVGPENDDASYTLILKTTFTEPGYNIYISKKPAKINVEAIFVETANPENVKALIISKNNPGRTFGNEDFDTGIRIGEAYAKCGKELGAWLAKKAF